MLQVVMVVLIMMMMMIIIIIIHSFLYCRKVITLEAVILNGNCNR